ncbi:MAG: biotin-dependent carboxyltransferase family protein [Roseivirga sp.]|nr:biotin-dependent carboxyltransferase family protein [Roseivirga sp.]
MAENIRLHFSKPGLQTTIQDQGRIGYQGLGIPVNGAMDRGAAQTANNLVGNSTDAPVLEITLMGPTIKVEGDGQIAIAGADLSAKINGEPVPIYETLDVMDGDEISFGRPVTGCRTYLAVRGSWQIASWLGSSSASATKASELTPQSAIQKGQLLEVVYEELVAPAVVAPEDRPDLSKLNIIRVLPGPEFSLISNLTIGDFFSQDFKISNDSNRMGYKLEGTLAHFESAQEVISSGIIPGTIQLTNAGQPIVLMADAQTSGGYTRLANIITEDLDKLAQMKPGDVVRFRLVGLNDI